MLLMVDMSEEVVIEEVLCMVVFMGQENDGYYCESEMLLNCNPIMQCKEDMIE